MIVIYKNQYASSANIIIELYHTCFEGFSESSVNTEQYSTILCILKCSEMHNINTG